MPSNHKQHFKVVKSCPYDCSLWPFFVRYSVILQVDVACGDDVMIIRRDLCRLRRTKVPPMVQNNKLEAIEVHNNEAQPVHIRCALQ